MLTVLEYVGAALMLTVGVAAPVLVIIVVTRAVRQQHRDADAAARRRMRNSWLFCLVVVAISIAAICIGPEAVIILAIVGLVLMVGLLPFIARADMRATRRKSTN